MDKEITKAWETLLRKGMPVYVPAENTRVDSPPITHVIIYPVVEAENAVQVPAKVLK